MGKKVKTINLGRLAEILGISRPTARALVKKDGFPIKKHGSPGVAYEFDAARVVQWKAAAEKELQAERQGREACLEQARIDMRAGRLVSRQRPKRRSRSEARG